MYSKYMTPLSAFRLTDCLEELQRTSLSAVELAAAAAAAVKWKFRCICR